MNKEEVMKLALKALEWSKPHADASITYEEAITALRAALAEEALQRLTDVQQEIEAALAQPQQEPVAWTTGLYGGYCVIRAANPASILPLNVALYTSPPAQRKPLTDEEMFELAEIAWRHGWASCRDAEYVGAEAEDERWGMVGAEVVQDIAAHNIKGGT